MVHEGLVYEIARSRHRSDLLRARLAAEVRAAYADDGLRARTARWLRGAASRLAHGASRSVLVGHGTPQASSPRA